MANVSITCMQSSYSCWRAWFKEGLLMWRQCSIEKVATLETGSSEHSFQLDTAKQYVSKCLFLHL